MIKIKELVTVKDKSQNKTSLVCEFTTSFFCLLFMIMKSTHEMIF